MDEDGFMPLFLAVQNRMTVEKKKIYFQNYLIFKLFSFAAENCKPIAAFAKNRVDVHRKNKEGKTALHFAIEDGKRFYHSM